MSVSYICVYICMYVIKICTCTIDPKVVPPSHPTPVDEHRAPWVPAQNEVHARCAPKAQAASPAHFSEASWNFAGGCVGGRCAAPKGSQIWHNTSNQFLKHVIFQWSTSGICHNSVHNLIFGDFIFPFRPKIYLNQNAQEECSVRMFISWNVEQS